MKTHRHLAAPQHEVVYQELVQLVAKNAAAVSPQEILAIAANMVGKLVAMQNQLVLTPEEAMLIVSKNIEMGNKMVIEQFSKAKGRA